jgi:molybdenum cofactor guanylyltransferase
MGETDKVLGLILAGGQGSRMGGVDKALIDLDGETLLARAIRRLAPQVSALAVSANGDPARFGAAHPVLTDPLTGSAGPLAGVLAGLDHAKEQGFGRVVTVAVDTPFFPDDLVRRLDAAQAPVAVAATTEEGGTRVHATCALWLPAAREPVRAALAAGERKLRSVAMSLGAVCVTFPAPCAFFNVNTPEDLSEARDHAAGQR